jgi:hypothetical protein
MQQHSDQVTMLYREYAAAAASWRSERSSSESALRAAKSEAAAQQAANAELAEGLRVLEGLEREGEEAGAAALRHKYADTVRRMAVVQVGAVLSVGETGRMHKALF